MHYTSVPNILKVLNPLFLDDLRAKLEEAGDNPRTLLNLRKRLARIRVFDPACGSGNFLVIAYKEMRKIEHEIDRRRGDTDRRSDIPLTNFRGIELRDFAAEIARLALIIAEFQCDELYRGQQEAVRDFLPLSAENWITCANALRIDWLSVCPPTGTAVKLVGEDLFSTPLEQSEIDFDNAGGETYICGNPPYRGSKLQTVEQKDDLAYAWARHPGLAKTNDLVCGWIARFLDYLEQVPDVAGAFVTTNSVCQGEQAVVWSTAFQRGCEICFAHTSFKWSNLASKNAGVTVVIVGLSKTSAAPKRLFQDDHVRQCRVIGPYLVPDSDVFVEKSKTPIGDKAVMSFGNMPRDGGHLLLNRQTSVNLTIEAGVARKFVKRFVGSEEMINGGLRYCLWIEESDLPEVRTSHEIQARMEQVAANRRQSNAASTRSFASRPHRFVQIQGTAECNQILVAAVSSENRDYLPVDIADANTIASNSLFAIYDAPLWNLAIVGSRIHLIWIATVCGKLKTDFRYSNTLGWNTFPIPTLTEQNRADLTRCAEAILLAREAHYPATIADLYAPDAMPTDLREAHERNDEVLERIYVGRRFRNDTERLEKLFAMYAQMTAAENRVVTAGRRRA
jgi:hypothetical protein